MPGTMERVASSSTSSKLETFIESWQSVAFQTGDYATRDRYSALLPILVQADGQEVELILRGNQPSLRELRLRDEDVEVLVKSLGSVSALKLTALDLSYNTLTDASVDFLSAYIKDPHCSLGSLNVAYNDIGPVGAETLSTALQFNTSLTCLSLTGCKIGRKGGVAVASMLQVNTGINKLDLSNTDLDTDSMIALATVLQGNRSVKCIDLSSPLLHSKLEETTIHVSKMLQVNCTLSELHLSKHRMTDFGVEWLCRMLKENTSLQFLDISCNHLSRDGAQHLANLLQHNATLTELDISYNRIEDDGLTNISNALAKFNGCLTRLNVCSNSITDRGLCSLADALKLNSSLTRVSIWGNRIGEPTCNAISDLLETGRLTASNVDVKPYEVDGTMYLANTK